MNREKIQLTVYGAEVKCASCVNAPGSKETFEWLQAAIGRKYSDDSISYQYFDIHTEGQKGADEDLVQQLLDEELFYPLVVVENQIVGEGNPRLKSIYKALEAKGIKPTANS
ncbi:YuzD family protein [Halobacillus sp. BBL2006]|uniref:YuzD family protein n=1 Tax=Halobacillus sp. BBL2006 TaxID=1543706 RepID=UPI000A6905E5|nr:YuzD family protein [Halobacillus sp. BBL2006]